MKTTILSLVLASIAGFMYCSDESLAVTQEPEDKELRALLEARRDTLKEVVRIFKLRTDTGVMHVIEFHKANIPFFEAELELAQSQKERIAVLEKTLEAHVEIEYWATQEKESGRAFPEKSLIATAARQKVEIDLYKAKKGI